MFAGCSLVLELFLDSGMNVEFRTPPRKMLLLLNLSRKLCILENERNARFPRDEAQVSDSQFASNCQQGPLCWLERPR